MSSKHVNATTIKEKGNNGNHKSHKTANYAVEEKRGYKPSDCHNPNKKKFLTKLSQQIWQKNYESTNVSKKIDLNKIFTPATDAEGIVPKNRKLYASSAFYSPKLHPTVEDQVELARIISHSLSDISNQQSRGQSMYVNRKKRSVKWVHEGCGQEESIQTSLENLNQTENINEENTINDTQFDKVPLKFLMNPHGQMRDINSLQESMNTETGLLSPYVSVEVMTALQLQKGKGAELFAKRRKISETWVVDENNIDAESPSGLADYRLNHQQSKLSPSSSILPAYTDAAKHRVQSNLHQDQLMEKYVTPDLKAVQTPWEAAVSSGSSSTAFVEEQKRSPCPASVLTCLSTPKMYDVSQDLTQHPNLSTGSDVYDKLTAKDDYHKDEISTNYQPTQAQPSLKQYICTNPQRELAYKPSIPQGWKAPSMSLPKDLYMSKDIPIKNCSPPLLSSISSPISHYFSNADPDINQSNNICNTSNVSSMFSCVASDSVPETKEAFCAGSTFPISKPYHQGFSLPLTTQPPKQQYLLTGCYQRVSHNSSQNIPQVSFNSSPLPYYKLARFEIPTTNDVLHISNPTRKCQLNGRADKVRNTSPTSISDSYYRLLTPSSETYNYRSTTNSFSPTSSCGSNTMIPHKNVTCKHLLNAPSYNSSARGWGCTDGKCGYQSSPNIMRFSKYLNVVNAPGVVYTDF